MEEPSEEQLLEILAEHESSLLSKYLSSLYYTFKPRADSPQEWDENLKCMSCPDEQTRFIKSKNLGIDVVLSGNGAGKSLLANWKIVYLLLNNAPPADLAKYWILNQTMEKASEQFQEKLRLLIPPDYIESIQWYNSRKLQPKSIIFKPHPSNGNRWLLLFASYEQGAGNFVATSQSVGFYLDEYYSQSILEELSRSCREFPVMPGARIITLTPSLGHPELEAIYNDKERHPEYTFYHYNTLKNKELGNMSWLDCVPKERLATRLYGAFTHPEGRIFVEFDKRHIIDILPPPPGAKHFLGIDFGASDTHLTACIWLYRVDGCYYVYDELGLSQELLENIIKKIKLQQPTFQAGKRLYQIYGDSAALQERMELGKAGIPCVPWKKEPVVSAIESVQSLFMQDKLFISKKCTRLINELRKYTWKANSKIDEPIKKEDDFVDALKGIIYSEVGLGDKIINWESKDKKLGSPFTRDLKKKELNNIRVR